MKKYTIDLNSLASNADPIDYLCKLFGFRSSKNNSLKSLYRSLLNNSEDMKKQVNRYADYFCACVSDQLKSYYWKYGKKYFTWLNSLL